MNMESRLVALEVKFDEMAKEQTEENGRLKTIEEKLDAMNAQLDRYKGFLGGIVFVFTCVGTFLKGWPLISSFFNK